VHYYAALKYTHWNMTIVPSNRLNDALVAEELDVIVAGGVRVADEATVKALRTFVEKGGVLIVGEEQLNEDLYGRPRDTSALLGVTIGPAEVVSSPETAATVFADIPLRAGIKVTQPLDQTEVVLRDSSKRPVITRCSRGEGLVYFQSADLIGYALAKVCGAILSDAATRRGAPSIPLSWRLAEVSSARGNRLATNVLLSRRSYATHHAFLLMNQDEYERAIRLKIPGLTGSWRVTQPLTSAAQAMTTGADLALEGVLVAIAPGSPAVVLMEVLETE